MAKHKLYEILASTVKARLNCIESGNLEWENRHEDKINELVKANMPSGSGFDNGTTLDIDNSTGEKLVFVTSFHHMAESGMYGRWTEHSVIVTPSLTSGFNLRITGRDRNDIKDYIAESFDTALTIELE